MRQWTRWVVFGGLLATALYDVAAIAVGGIDASVSQFITDCTANPRLLVVCSCLATHFFGWVMIPEAYLVEMLRKTGKYRIEKV